MSRRYETASQLLVFTVEYLVEMINRGSIRIPAYARRYVWNQDQTIALFDSIARGYPIGTLLFSEGPAPDEEITFGPLTIRASADERAYWVVDGQQRLVSLAAALTGSNALDPRFNLAFDLRAEAFILNPGRRDSSVVPLDVLYNISALHRWLNDEAVDLESAELATEISWNIRRFQVAVHVIQNKNPAVTLEIFERLNTSGVSLRESDLFSAFATGSAPSGRARNVEDTAQLLADRTGFGIIDDHTVMRSILAVNSVNITRISDITYGELNSTYDRGEEALTRAIIFLQEIADVPHVTFLSSNYLLIALTRFFALHPEPDSRNLTLLRRWFWRSSMVSTRSGSTRNLGVLREYLRSIGDGRTSQTLQSMLRVIGVYRHSYPDVSRFALRTPATKLLLCSWWSLRPFDFITGDPVTRSDLSSIIGHSNSAGRVTELIVQENSRRALSSANRVLLPTSTGSPINLEDHLLQPNMRIDDVTWGKVLRSHLITEGDLESLRQGNRDAFWGNRNNSIRGQFERSLDLFCEWDFEDTPSLNDLVIEEDEDE